MQRDERYLMIKVKIENGSYESFKDIFRADFPKTKLAAYLGTNNNRMGRLINNPREFQVQEIDKIADYFDVKAELLFELMLK